MHTMLKNNKMNKLLLAICTIYILASCGNKTKDLQLAPISDYAPLTIGKYISYSLDSLVFTNFGTVEAHRLYQVKYLVADTLLDNLGRKGYRINRQIRATATDPYVNENTFFALNTGTTLEFTENNLKFIKLAMPINNGYNWRGNSAINYSTVLPDIGNLFFLEDWDYTYENVGETSPIAIPGYTLNNTITIAQKNTSFNLPIGPTTVIASKDFAKEIYAQDIGMVYRQFIHWEYQNAKYKGFGVTMKMIDHN
jgi:hypothetical protein